MPKTDAVLWSVPVALVLLTRLPLPRLPDAVFADQARAVWAFPLAGALVGLITVVVGFSAEFAGLPLVAIAGLMLASQVVATGAMHEDGLADTVDGLWGGWTPERRLDIMKDSRIGVYGVLALVFSVGLRWSALVALLSVPGAIWSVVGIAALSRAAMPVLMTILPPARPGGLSSSVGTPGVSLVMIGLGLGGLLAIWTAGPVISGPAFLAGIAVFALAHTARRRVGGQTGDILGATQQVTETVLLLGLAALV